MSPIRVAVCGALGKVGREVLKGVVADPELILVGSIDIKATSNRLFEGPVDVPLSPDPAEIINTATPDVIVDFTLAKTAMATVRIAAQKKTNMVIGTTGFTADEIKEMDQLAQENNIGIVLAPNFALGAVIMMHLAKLAAKFFDYAEIIELHHNQKLDAPSGTSLATAESMVESRGKPFQISPGPDRGEMLDGVTIHSVRLPGLLAHQEIIFGAAGQTLSIRHDTINRECFNPGVLLAIKEVIKHKGLIRGLDSILGL